MGHHKDGFDMVSHMQKGEIDKGAFNRKYSKGAAVDPSDLLPKDDNSQWGSLNPAGNGDLKNVNLLQSGYHQGIDTVGSSLRNANLQVRSEPPNPTTKVSPWMNATIEPDLMRVPLEIGCGSQ